MEEMITMVTIVLVADRQRRWKWGITVTDLGEAWWGSKIVIEDYDLMTIK